MVQALGWLLDSVRLWPPTWPLRWRRRGLAWDRRLVVISDQTGRMYQLDPLMRLVICQHLAHYSDQLNSSYRWQQWWSASSEHSSGSRRERRKDTVPRRVREATAESAGPTGDVCAAGAPELVVPRLAKEGQLARRQRLWTEHRSHLRYPVLVEESVAEVVHVAAAHTEVAAVRRPHSGSLDHRGVGSCYSLS